MRFWALALVLSLVALGMNVKGERDDYDDISSIISESMFNEMLMHHNYDNDECPDKGFYTYQAFIAAAKTFNDFGSTGDHYTRKREIAAFLAQTSHQTTGYCFKEYISKPGNYCIPSEQWPCSPGKEYHERGPFQLSNNYNYGQAGDALAVDLLTNPDLVATDPVIYFKTALWFWMTPQQPKPSCHDAITDQWTPSEADKQGGRVPGYGLCTNIINGDRECGKGSLTLEEQSRIRFYKQYCDILEVSYGDNLDCSYQKHYEYLQLKSGVQCGKDAGGRVCPGNACCSQWGFCGHTDLHCNVGCQSNCNFYNCGPKANGARCPRGQCCHRDGYCSATREACVTNCLSQCTQPRCGRQGNGARCPFFLCCSQWGYCGSTEAYCRTGCQSQCKLPECGRQVGGALCPGNRCCNRYGYCHINVPCGPGCQTKCDLITLRDHLLLK